MISMGKKQNKMFLGAAGLSLAALLAMGVTGCSSPAQDENIANENGTEAPTTTVVVEENQTDENIDSKTADEELSSPAPLEVTDFGWFASENNMVDFSVSINNPNQYVSADDVVLTVNGLDENGEVFFTQDINLSAIAPESDYVFSYVTGDDSNNPKTPNDISVTVNVADDGWSIYNENEKVEYDVSDVAVTPSDIEGVNVFTGNILGKDAVAENPDGQAVDGQAMANVVLYDENGKMLGGYFDIVDMNGQEKVPFEIYAVGAPAYKDYKVFVSPFSFEDVQVGQVSE